MTPERVKVVDFLTYFDSGYGLLMRAGATGLDINDLCGRTLVLTRGSAQVAVAEKLSADCVKARRKEIGSCSSPTAPTPIWRWPMAVATAS